MLLLCCYLTPLSLILLKMKLIDNTFISEFFQTPSPLYTYGKEYSLNSLNQNINLETKPQLNPLISHEIQLQTSGSPC
ncbi:hypothetical protein Hanom_Chr04g00351591 [Helianthus anomalus]